MQHKILITVRRTAAALALLSVAAQSQTLTVVGLDGATKSLGMAELRALPQVEHVDSGPNGVTRYQGPTLRSLVTLAGAPEGRAMRGPAMTIVVLAEATDGYKVVYSLAELDDQFASGTALVALSQNGQPLASNEGPLRVVMPGPAQHRSRWIRQLTTLRLLQLGKPPGST